MPPEINDEDVLSWYPLSPQVAVTHHQEYEETLRLIRLADTAEILQYILNLAREWEMKHDFELWGKKEEAFRNKRAIISSGIRRATLEEGHYGLVRDVYTEIRHTAHLCKEYQLIIDTSRWLIEHACSISDLQTLVKAKVTLAWTFTSARDQHPKMLYEAFGILGELKSIIECSEFLEEISENDMDVIAIFCELQLRLRIRLWRQRGHSLSEEECLRTLMSSKELLGRSRKFRNLDPRLQQRFSIPLHYQRGIWFFYIQDFRESIKVFEEISERASLIGWERVQQGAFSWLASNFQEIQDEYNLRIYLDKINKSYFPKRLLIRERLSNGNSSAE
jgi:hypothetical protein